MENKFQNKKISTKMTSSIETIGHKLQSLEQRLHAENESNALLKEKLKETTPNRQNRKMFLPVMPMQSRENETDKKLRKIMKQTGILTINGIQYQTDIKDLTHIGDLGNGTSGNVVKMRHIPSGTIIAVKQMRRTGNSEENKRILMDLDVVLKSHDCPYIVQCLGCFVRDPDVWICMELMSMCFDKLLKLSKNPVPEDILGKVTVATVKALSYLKEKHGVIHRDVKPSNILIDERGNIKLCDFGISGRLVDSKANTRSAGCAAYMAPERIDPKKPKYDIRADVWSLGITLVELATAQSPYEGCNNDFEVLTKVLDSDPPSLPHGEGFNFSPEFYAFVSKCLTKNYQFRPKYPELLEQAFIKKYEVANIDVPKWFLSVVESAGIETHHRTSTTLSKTTQDTKAAIKLNSNKNTSNATAAAAASSKLTTTTTTNSNKISHIPSYQQLSNQNRYKREEDFLSQQPQHQQQPQSHFQHHGHHQITHIPQPIGTGTGCGTGNGAGYYQNSNNLHCPTDRVIGGCGAGSGSSSATSSSPLSPPNVVSSASYYANKDDRDGPGDGGGGDGGNGGNGVGNFGIENNKFYQRSPFLQRKFNNNTNYGVGESPKRETAVPTTSVLSSIGQSIIRNLTTSPFSQKKHSITQPNQIDPLWRMPTTQDVAVAFDCYETSNMNAAAKSNRAYSNSPFLGRKRIPTVDEKIIATATGIGLSGAPTTTDTLRDRGDYYHRQQQTNENFEATNNLPQRAHGSQSPLVLQRFYHQQNQLREKELERLQQHQPQPQHRTLKETSPERQLQQTNPFLNNCQNQANATSSTTTTATPNLVNLHYNHQYNSHIPLPMSLGNGGSSNIGAASISSHSTTSSQSSSTLSTSSQIAHAPKSTAMLDHQFYGNENSAAAFGGLAAKHASIGGGQLQYQPLPQQYLRSTNVATSAARNTRSPPQSPEQLSEPILSASGAGGAGVVGVASGSVTSKLNRFYARRHMQGTGSLTSSPGNGRHTFGSDMSSVKENNPKEDHGTRDNSWFNTLAGAMKRQFASYVKLQLHSSTAATSTSTSASTTKATDAVKLGGSADIGGKSTLPYYQRSTSLTTNGSSVGGGGLSPTELRSKIGIIDGNTTTGSFLRRYAASSGAGAGSNSIGRINDFTTPTMANAHILAGLDRRHRSPDPPPRFNRGQSPLLLRKNLLELSGQPPGGSPLLNNRRYVTASPPLPPPRRGSESVPGSPQHFRTRIHYTPEPQRRIYRTIDQ